MTGLAKTLDYNCTAPYMVIIIINKNAYKLDLPKTIRNNNVFHVLQLDKYTPLVIAQLSSESNPVLVYSSDDWEVQQILDSMQCYRMLYNLV